MKDKNKFKWFFRWVTSLMLATVCLVNHSSKTITQANETRSSHIGTFEGETTFSLSSDTGIFPSIEIETKDVYGNTHQYQSEDGRLVIPNTEEGSSVKRAILKGQTLVNLINDGSEEKQVGLSDKTLAKYNYIHQLDHTKIYTLCFEVNGFFGENYFNVSVSSGKNGGSGVVSKDGIYKLKINPNPFNEGEMTGLWFYWETPRWSIGNQAFVKNILLLDGDYTNVDISYFEGTQSVQSPILTISNEDGSRIAEITIEEDLILRSNGAVYDELDLMTGKFTQRLDENNEVLDEEVVRYVKIYSTHAFDSIQEADISVKGDIDQTIASITVPTAALTFTLNPNLEPDKQFIAPDFSISNESRAPIRVELKSFEQVTNVLNDVLPTKYDSWEGLNKVQSKDIALALIPQASDGWISLNEGTYYVADTSNNELGQIKGNSTVDFKFSALHGQAFSETLNPAYRLTFVFEL